jgi:hypothetical protein
MADGWRIRHPRDHPGRARPGKKWPTQRPTTQTTRAARAGGKNEVNQKNVQAGVLYEATGYPDSLTGDPFPLIPVVFLQDKTSGVFEYLHELGEMDPDERPSGWPVRRLGKEDFFGAGRKQRSTDFCGFAAVTGPAEDLEDLDCQDELSRFEARWPPSRAAPRWTLIGSISAVKDPWSKPPKPKAENE